MNQYTIISSERSPFGRICRLFMTANGIDFNFRVLNFVDDRNHAEMLAKETPINKVPVLVVNDAEKIFDSRVIVNYLIKTHGLPALTVAEENIVSAIYSCLDVSVILFLMRANGYDINADNIYLQRQRGRIPTCLEYIKPWATELDPKKKSDWNYASMSLYSFLYWAERRAKTVQLKDYPHFQKFLDDFSDAPGVSSTGF